nr:MAG TPA: hypothetical protein [Caudoviricetes sp.]
MANKGFPDSKPGEKEEVPASHCQGSRRHQHHQSH